MPNDPFQLSSETALGSPDDDSGLQAVAAWFSGHGDLPAKFGSVVRSALDAVIDTPNTGRWDLEQCDRVEKTYVGFKVENLIRGTWDLEYGAEMDYQVAGVDVDCKWSKKFNGWQIPMEAVGHLCLLVWADDHTNELAVGLVRIHDAILVGGNQDKKRTLQSPGGTSRIHWLVERGPYLPPNFLLHLDETDRTAILNQPGGNRRAEELFRRCQGVIIPRHVVDSVGRQIDSARRMRNVREKLNDEGIVILNGTWKDAREIAEQLGGPVPGQGEWVSLPAAPTL